MSRTETLAEICSRNPNDPRCPRPTEQFIPGVGGGGGGIERRQMAQFFQDRRTLPINITTKSGPTFIPPPLGSKSSKGAQSGGPSGAISGEVPPTLEAVPPTLVPPTLGRGGTAVSSEVSVLPRLRRLNAAGVIESTNISSEANTSIVPPTPRGSGVYRGVPPEMQSELRRLQEYDPTDHTIPTLTTNPDGSWGAVSDVVGPRSVHSGTPSLTDPPAIGGIVDDDSTGVTNTRTSRPGELAARQPEIADFRRRVGAIDRPPVAPGRSGTAEFRRRLAEVDPEFAARENRRIRAMGERPVGSQLRLQEPSSGAYNARDGTFSGAESSLVEPASSASVAPTRVSTATEGEVGAAQAAAPVAEEAAAGAETGIIAELGEVAEVL